MVRAVGDGECPVHRETAKFPPTGDHETGWTCPFGCGDFVDHEDAMLHAAEHLRALACDRNGMWFQGDQAGEEGGNGGDGGDLGGE